MLSHFKRRFGIFTAVAVLAVFLPTFSSTPAGAAPSVALIYIATDAPALYKACPTSADIPAAGFTDTTDTSVDCLAYYGITLGTTATTYEPTASVARWAMALYLTRTLSKAGVTLGTGADQGFTDISGKSAEIQTAINQLKQLGVTVGTTATTYSPDDNVIRQEMALFIERMLDNIAPGPGGVTEAELVGGAATAYINSNCGAVAACTGKYNYTDIDSGTVTVEASNSIKELFTLGVHDGIAATTFSPDADMTRAAMATMLEAALNHSNLRPAGLIIQSSSYASIGANTHTLSVSHRDASHVPITGTAVDVFRWTPTLGEGDRAFATATGLCEDAVLTAGAVNACVIDVGEPVTDLTGNFSPTANTTAVLYQSLGVAGTDNYYAWTSALATAFDNDIHGASADAFDTIAVVANLAATDTNCSVDTAAYAATASAHIVDVNFGTTHTVTCQVRSIAATDLGVAVPEPLTAVTFNRTRINNNLGAVASSATAGAENVVCYTDATGKCEFTITGPAVPVVPLATDIVNDLVVITMADATATAGELPVTGTSGFMTEGGGGTTLTFGLKYKGAAAVSGRTAITQSSASHLASLGGAVGGVVRTVTATHYDIYGAAKANIAVAFSSKNYLHQGAACTAASPAACTLAGHNLAIGDDVILHNRGALRGTGGGSALDDTGQTFIVATAGFTTSVLTFTATFGDSALLAANGGTASTAASPALFATTSFTTASRTTNSAGQASFSWTDVEDTSAVDVITATPASPGTAASVRYYRLAAPADVTEVGNGNAATTDDSENNSGCVAIDTTAKTYIVINYDDTDGTHAIVKYMKFSYDDNDQFGTGGGAGVLLDGVPGTEAAWQALMVTACGAGAVVTLAAAPTTSAIRSTIASVDYVAGLSTDIQRHILG